MIAAIGAALVLLALVWHLRQPEQLVARYQEDLATLPDDEIERPLRKFAELGDAGLKALAEALVSEREAIRKTAHRVLLEEVDQWELLSEEAVAPRLESLAHELAQTAPRMDRENRRFASDLALRLLLWPRAADSRPASWLTNCEAVLAAAVEQGRTANDSTTVALAMKGENASNLSQPRTGVPSLVDLATTLADKVQLPGGGLPLEIAPMPEGSGFIEPNIERNAPSPSNEPRRLEVPTKTRSLKSDSDNGDDDNDDDTGPAGANRPGRLPSGTGSSHPIAMGLQARKQSLGDPPANDTAAWRRLKPRDVMRRLHVSDPQVVLAAREELEHRGISGPLMDLARRATDADPKVRRELAESLPSLPGIDAKPWLLELSYDENSQVRATAVTLMGTSGDLEMVRRLEQISRDDPDDYIRAQAAKVLVPRLR